MDGGCVAAPSTGCCDGGSYGHQLGQHPSSSAPSDEHLVGERKPCLSELQRLAAALDEQYQCKTEHGAVNTGSGQSESARRRSSSSVDMERDPGERNTAERNGVDARGVTTETRIDGSSSGSNAVAAAAAMAMLSERGPNELPSMDCGAAFRASQEVPVVGTRGGALAQNGAVPGLSLAVTSAPPALAEDYQLSNQLASPSASQPQLQRQHQQQQPPEQPPQQQQQHSHVSHYSLYDHHPAVFLPQLVQRQQQQQAESQTAAPMQISPMEEASPQGRPTQNPVAALPPNLTQQQQQLPHQIHQQHPRPHHHHLPFQQQQHSQYAANFVYPTTTTCGYDVATYYSPHGNRLLSTQATTGVGYVGGRHGSSTDDDTVSPPFPAPSAARPTDLRVLGTATEDVMKFRPPHILHSPAIGAAAAGGGGGSLSTESPQDFKRSSPSPYSPARHGALAPPAAAGTLAHRKQQRRLLKKMHSAITEYHSRTGEECCIIATVKHSAAAAATGQASTTAAANVANGNSMANAAANSGGGGGGGVGSDCMSLPVAGSGGGGDHSRELVVFGSQILRNAVNSVKPSLERTVQSNRHEINNHPANSLSSSSLLPTATTLSPSNAAFLFPAAGNTLPTPPRDVEAMNGNELKSYVPLLLRALAFGRARPMWDKVEHRPPWWPEWIPFKNVRMDTRKADERNGKTWSECLRVVVRSCFKFYHCAHLLDNLPKEVTSSPSRSLPRNSLLDAVPLGNATTPTAATAASADVGTPSTAMLPPLPTPPCLPSTPTIPLSHGETPLHPTASPMSAGANSSSSPSQEDTLSPRYVSSSHHQHGHQHSQQQHNHHQHRQPTQFSFEVPPVAATSSSVVQSSMAVADLQQAAGIPVHQPQHQQSAAVFLPALLCRHGDAPAATTAEAAAHSATTPMESAAVAEEKLRVHVLDECGQAQQFDFDVTPHLSTGDVLVKLGVGEGAAEVCLFSDRPPLSGLLAAQLHDQRDVYIRKLSTMPPPPPAHPPTAGPPPPILAGNVGISYASFC